MNQVFAENPAYAILATVGSTLYLLKMIMFLVSGDGDGDMDSGGASGDIDGDHHADGGESFSLVSTQSILAFLMGTGWIGLAAKREWGLDDMMALFAATGFGIAMMLFSSFITFKIKRFNSIPKFNINSTIGKTGRAYTNIPEKGEGVGQVQIAVQEKLQILPASSVSEAIKSFENIIVEDVDDSGNLIVKKV